MLKGTWPHSIPSPHKGKGGRGISGLLVIALCGVPLNALEDIVFIQADGSSHGKSKTGREAEAEREKAD